MISTKYFYCLSFVTKSQFKVKLHAVKSPKVDARWISNTNASQLFNIFLIFIRLWLGLSNWIFFTGHCFALMIVDFRHPCDWMKHAKKNWRIHLCKETSEASQIIFYILVPVISTIFVIILKFKICMSEYITFIIKRSLRVYLKSKDLQWIKIWNVKELPYFFACTEVKTSSHF